MKKKRVYIIGICGVTTAAIAKMFKDLGWQVSGSDQGSFPPMSEYLKKNKIFFNTSYEEKNIEGKPDLVMVGGNALALNPQNPEYLKAKKLDCQIVSYPEVLEKYVIKKNSIVITGTYGKTTIAALVALILEKAGLTPSFMLGGVCKNFFDGVRVTNSEYSVVEGDEHPTLNFSPEPKFMHYKPRLALVTSAQWDHLNVFPTEKKFVNAFIDFVKLVPKDGLLVICVDGKNVSELIKAARCKVVTYSTKKEANWQPEKIKDLSLKAPLIGEHNRQNVLGAVALTASLGIKMAVIKEALESFRGIRRRLEVKGVVNGVTVTDDLAHSPIKIRETLKALRINYTGSDIYAVFDPHASSFRDRRTLAWYDGVFDAATYVLVGKLPLFKGTLKDQRVLGSDIVKAIKKTQPNVKYLPKDAMIIDFLGEHLKKGDIAVFLSSGGFRGLVNKTLDVLYEKSFS